MLKRLSINQERKILYKNTLMLYILRFSTYFFGFITVPYQTRVLGSDIYGKVGEGMALMLYFQLLIDFGFILSATQEIAYVVAEDKNNKRKISEIYSAIQYGKFALIAIATVVLACICYFNSHYGEDPLFYFVFLIGTAVNGLVPDFVYRGMQEMGAVTMRVIISRLIFTGLIFRPLIWRGLCQLAL